MGIILSGLKAIGRAIIRPFGVLDDYAQEPLKRWEHKRMEEAKDNALRREIERNTAERKFESDMRMREATHQTDLEIRMQTEINRINAETEQWVKDEEFRRHTEVLNAFEHYMEKLSELNLKTVKAIGLMDIELREKAQDLIREKTQQYYELQGRATKDAEEELERIEQKFANNERMQNIMIGATEKKLANILNATTKFLEELSIDIQKMNNNIDLLIDKGQDLINQQLSNLGNLKLEGATPKAIGNADSNTEDANYEEVK